MEADGAMHVGWKQYSGVLIGCLLLCGNERAAQAEPAAVEVRAAENRAAENQAAENQAAGNQAAETLAAGNQAAAIQAEVQGLANHAAAVFVGQIISIERRGGAVEVSFRVEQTVRGASGARVVLREWAGNWAPGQTRYVVGSRVLAFLHGSSAAGLSSPVHGAEGLIPVVVQGANAPRLLDVRRVAASVVRAPGTPLPTEADGALPLDGVLQWIAGGNGGALAGVALPTHGRPSMILRPTSGPVETTIAIGMRPVQKMSSPKAPAEGRVSNAHR